jgi:hypothetical protein
VGDPPNSGAAPARQSAPTGFTNALKFARCMRANGEPGFPDPGNPGGFSTGALASLNTSAPAFVSSTKICDRLLPNDGQPTEAEFQQATADGLRFARCMRAHGVDFPDPGIAGRHLTINLTNVDTSSPQYLRAGPYLRDRSWRLTTHVRLPTAGRDS